VISLSDRNPYEVHAELMQRIERLEAENEQLRARIKTLEARLDQILILANLE